MSNCLFIKMHKKTHVRHRPVCYLFRSPELVVVNKQQTVCLQKCPGMPGVPGLLAYLLESSRKANFVKTSPKTSLV